MSRAGGSPARAEQCKLTLSTSAGSVSKIVRGFGLTCTQVSEKSGRSSSSLAVTVIPTGCQGQVAAAAASCRSSIVDRLPIDVWEQCSISGGYRGGYPQHISTCAASVRVAVGPAIDRTVIEDAHARQRLVADYRTLRVTIGASSVVTSRSRSALTTRPWSSASHSSRDRANGAAHTAGRRECVLELERFARYRSRAGRQRTVAWSTPRVRSRWCAKLVWS